MKKHVIKRHEIVRGASALALLVALSAFDAMAERSVPPVPAPAPMTEPTPASVESSEKTGLILKKAGVSDGYVLIATKEVPSVYLIDSDGHIVHEWTPPRKTSQAAHVLPNGNLLRTARPADGKVGDIIEEITWDGELVWEYITDRDVQRIHHNVERLPNGNVLISVWEKKTREEYVAVGRNPDTVSGNVLWVDAVYEVKPTGKTTGEVVWRWSPWDRLIQNVDPKAENYGNPADHPDRIDVNQTRISDEFPRLSDWLHVNSITYNPDRDEIFLSPHSFSELWVVSRKTGDLVYRWGNPLRYGKGSKADQVLFNPHAPHLIPEGMRGAGNILVFNNEVGEGKGAGEYSSVMEVQPPLTESGEWPAPAKDGFPPCRVVWDFSGPPGAEIYSKALSNAQRLENGNTLICMGTKGEIVEVDPDENIVWSYVNPVFRKEPPMQSLEKWHSRPLPAGNMMFRAYKYAPDYPAFAGKDIIPGRLLMGVADESQKPEPVQ